MSKYIVLGILGLLIVVGVSAQPFEGKVVYQNTYKSKIPNVSDANLTAMMGSSMEYHFKEGNYMTVTNGSLLQWQLYLRKDNKLYNKMAGSVALFWNDGAVNEDEVIKSEINKGVAEVLGYRCDELVLTCKSGVQKYYFTNKLKVDPAWFTAHKFGNWADVVSKTKALPVKIEIDNAQFTLNCTATKIEEGRLDGQLFVLPPDAPLQKSPY